MKPKQSELNGKQQRATRHLRGLWLLPLLIGLVLAGCRHNGKVAAVAGEGQPTANVSRTRDSEPPPKSDNLSIRATASPASCAEGESTTITAIVLDDRGAPAPGAFVQISAGGGRFLSSADATYDPKARLHGPYSASGTSDQAGRFMTWWVVNPAAAGYVMSIQAKKEGWGGAQTNLLITIKR
jgi:hypothetical protein